MYHYWPAITQIDTAGVTLFSVLLSAFAAVSECYFWFKFNTAMIVQKKKKKEAFLVIGKPFLFIKSQLAAKKSHVYA